MRVVAVIPAYNEEQVVASVVQKVREYHVEPIVVDDGSQDATTTVAKKAGAIVLRHFLNRGQGAALQTGITYALQNGADIIVTFDADGQFLAEEIEKVIAPIKAGKVDAILGTRFAGTATNVPAARKLMLQVAAGLTRFYTGLRVTDAHNGFRAFNRTAAAKLHIQHDGMAHASDILEQIAATNLRYMEVPVTVRYTDYSLAKGQKMSGSLKIIWDLFFGRLR